MKFLGRHGLDIFLVALAAGQGTAILLTAGSARFAAAALAVAAVAALLMRRLNPLVASLAALAANGACLSLLGDAPTLVFFGLLSTFVIIAAINTVRKAVVCWLAGTVLIALSVWVSAPPAAAADFALTLGLCTVMWVAGLLLSRRTRQAELMAMRLELSELERMRDLGDERARIARELHDVVSHGLTVVVLQTVAPRTLLADLAPGGPGEIDRHLNCVEEAARDAPSDMRRMLGLLETGDRPRTDGPAPVPQLSDLGELANRARQAGADVDDSGVDAPAGLPATLELTAYRIVQEALTNAIKYAPGSPVAVRLARHGASLRVEVTDDGGPASPGTPTLGGRGLLGMRERVAAYGGTLEAGRLAGGGFHVLAVLPLGAQAGKAPAGHAQPASPPSALPPGGAR